MLIKHLRTFLIAIIALEILALNYLLYELNTYEYPEPPTIEYIRKEKTIEEKIYETFPEEPDTMLAIARCESGLNQSAVSHTDDHGLMQINAPSWDSKAEELGLDYKGSADDNLRMARYIYDHGGKEHWVCFTKNLI